MNYQNGRNLVKFEKSKENTPTRTTVQEGVFSVDQQRNLPVYIVSLRITKYNLALRADSTKCSQARLAVP